MRPITLRVWLTFGIVSFAGAAASAAPRPNIVLIVADDLGYSDIGCYGGEIATPQLDALARGGLRFTQFYNSGRCWPTRAALMTGFYAQQVHRDLLPEMLTGKGTRPGWAKLLPAMLAPASYRTYHAGKWHIDGEPIENGFDRAYELRDQDRHFSPRYQSEDGRRLPAVARDAGFYGSVAVADHAIRYLREHASAHASRPFLLHVAFTVPHFPLQALPEDIGRVGRRYEAGWDSMRAARWDRIRELGLVKGELSPIEREVTPPYPWPGMWEKIGYHEVFVTPPWEKLDARQRTHQATKMSLHAAMIERMDREIGRIVEELRRVGVCDDTLILFLSDNGASAEMLIRGDGHDAQAAPGSADTYLCLGPGWSSVANTPFRRHKSWTHEGGIATPLIAHWPSGITARGELRHAPGHVIDFVPTLLELAGVEVRGQAGPEFPGRSLVPAFDRDPGWERRLWWWHEDNRAWRRGDWKLVASGVNAAWELYDLSVDRCETRNLAAKQPDLVRQLEREWHEMTDAIAASARRK